MSVFLARDLLISVLRWRVQKLDRDSIPAIARQPLERNRLFDYMHGSKPGVELFGREVVDAIIVIGCTVVNVDRTLRCSVREPLESLNAFVNVAFAK